MANGGLVCSPLYMLYVHSIVGARPVRLIETYTFRFRGAILRSYSTFNRDIHKIYQPIRLIESILIIETQEYLRQVLVGSMK